jgi:hypothetical protein
VNDSASGFRHAYEILWGDDDSGAADWVRDEFEHFWAQGVDLPDRDKDSTSATFRQNKRPGVHSPEVSTSHP